MAQSPAYEQQPAVVPAGSRVVIVASRGPAPVSPVAYVDVPELAGQTQGAALSKLQDAGLQARVFNDYSESYARGRVMGQVPRAGASAASGSEVALLVSSGAAASHAPAVALPDAIGLQEAQAVARLQAAGLSPQVVREYSQTVPEGVVFAQLPDRAWLASRPAARPAWWIWAATAAVLALLLLVVFFLFGRGANAQVPNVIGQDQTSAIAELQAAGFTPQPRAARVETDAPVGTVVAQNPAAGTSRPRGSAVTIDVLAAAEEVAVPKVVGLARDAAVARLAQAGFSASVVEQRAPDSPAGEVIEQRPPAGSAAAPGSQVTIVVARAEQVELVEVPDVTGLVRADVEATLEEAGLRVVVVENPDPEVAAGVAALQFPEAGDEVAPGTTVAVIVSSGAPEDATTTGVPDVVGEELQDAQEAIADAGLSSQPVAVDGTEENAGDVIAQLPAAGSAVSPGSTIVLFYASGR